MSLQQLLVGLLVFNILSFYIFYTQFMSASPSQSRKEEQQSNQVKNIVLNKSRQKNLISKIEKQKKKYILELFTKLYQYPKIQTKYYLGDTVNGRHAYQFFGRPFIGIKKDDSYCKKSDRYHLQHMNEYFKEVNIFTNYPRSSIIRQKVINLVGREIEYNSALGLPRSIAHSSSFSIPEQTQIFFSKTTQHIFTEIGRHFNCFFQMYNIIPGHASITRKDFLVDSVREYSKQFYDKPTQCFDRQRFVPKSYYLSNKEDCQQFFRDLDSPEIQQRKRDHPIQYIVKDGDGQHRGETVYIFDNKKEQEIREKYQNGSKCGELQLDGKMVQRYIDNPLLIKKHKFDFRLYFAIASTDPLILYYHDGFLRISLKLYDDHSNVKDVHLTNTQLSKGAFKQAEKKGENVEELKQMQMWTLDKLQEYLLNMKIITDTNWLNNYLRPAFKRALIHLGKMAAKTMIQDHRVFHFFGVDFIMDEELNIYFIEANITPSIQPSSEEKEIFQTHMLTDLFELITAYQRSRAKRIFSLLGNVAEEMAKNSFNVTPTSHDEIKKRNLLLNMDVVQDKFNQYKQNLLDPAYELSPLNGWNKIYDANLPDPYQAHMKLIDPSCFQ